jgi:nucleoside-diphosphate-sugar epimerase
MATTMVTGATGFLGSHLVRALLAEGHEVVATGRDVAKAPAGCSFVAADLTRSDDLDRLIEPAGHVDAVIHAAGLSSPWGSRQAFHSANVEGTRNALKLARACRARRFVHISTPSVYFRFRDQVGVKETEPLPPPVNAYAASKREAEKLVLDEPAIEAIVLRPRGLYGKGDTALLPRMIAVAARRPLPLLRGGRAVTDITHVEDAAAAVLAALEAPSSAAGSVYNISGGEPLPLRQIIEEACARCGIRPRWRAMSTRVALGLARAAEWTCAALPGRPEPPITAYGIGLLAYSQTLDIHAARRELGWAPLIPFSRGLDLTFADGA